MKNFPEYHKELQTWMQKMGQSIPGVMQGFGTLHENSLKEGELDRKTKELLALGIAIASRCDGCIAYHTHDAMKAGATDKEIAEVVGVTVMMRGGPSVVYGVQAMQAVTQFQEQGL